MLHKGTKATADIYERKEDAGEEAQAELLPPEEVDAEMTSKPEAQNGSPEPPELAEYNTTSCGAQIHEFMDRALTAENIPCMSTGFNALDNALDGGLYEGLYIIGALSSLGKTTFIHQICDSIAKEGNDILFFSLEMARFELIAKSISRTSFFSSFTKYGNQDYAATSREILNGMTPGNMLLDKIQHIQASAGDYGQHAGNVFVKEGGSATGAEQLRADLAEHIRIRQKRPVVVIDYLQILSPFNPKFSDKQNTDANISELKRISRDFHVPVIAISSLNRSNYDEPINMAAFKESGAIEYSADVLIGLQFSGVGKTERFDINEAKARYPRDIELVILKSRMGPTGGKLPYKFFASYNTFAEA